MSRIEGDPEELVTEVTIDDRLQLAAHLPDAERAVPFGDGLEIRGNETVDVVVRTVGQFGRVLDHEPGAAIEGSPDAERHGERIAALDPAVARAQQSVPGPRGPAVSIR